jgi:hypothetical protein
MSGVSHNFFCINFSVKCMAWPGEVFIDIDPMVWISIVNAYTTHTRHTHIHTLIHTHTHSYTLIHTHTHSYTLIHTHTHTYTHTHIPTIHTLIHTHTYTHTHIQFYLLDKVYCFSLSNTNIQVLT